MSTRSWTKPTGVLRLFLGGDVMTGRAIDQLFPTHNPDDFGKPDHVPATQYQQWSAALHGAEMLPQRHDYPWGAALGILEAAQPDFRLVNLETAITTADQWARKQFNFRMHPANIACLTAAGIDCVSLANNHVLDFGAEGLRETLATLDAAGIQRCGAGDNLNEASRPAVHVLPTGQRILVFAWGFKSSHIVFPDWAAGSDTPGIQYVEHINEATAKAMRESIAQYRQPGDVVIASLHWGANWVKAITPEYRKLARYLIDAAGVDLIHGHSSHHVLPAETYQGKLILYGCGDLINDSEGRPEYRARRGYLGALYFVDLDPDTHRLRGLRVQPVQRRRFRLEMPAREDASWVLSQIRGPRKPDSGNP